MKIFCCVIIGNDYHENICYSLEMAFHWRVNSIVASPLCLLDIGFKKCQNSRPAPPDETFWIRACSQ